MKIYNNISLIIPILLFFSCSKDDNTISDSDRHQALLGQWEYQAIMTDRAVDINGDGTVNIDLFNTQEIRQCIKDNLTFFTERGVGENGGYAINENGLSCDDQDPFSTIEEDSYELIDNSIIRFVIRNEMRIIDLTRSKMIVETNDTLGNENVIVTITFKKS
ncbi:hypothetical protein KCTC52924_03538 [Arenibacter antarcticus]|uniref:Lipocalin-like domain-containing protein n=1 Tax=Arenibacter antarcticus TaxID=2040469 RepID=A0ABW5VE36_9FLAO|nr:hypothetical protein [Arenibacter sp. H213]MCM4166598.1 hypothetical protein [Arenibacter sp. H213]